MDPSQIPNQLPPPFHNPRPRPNWKKNKSKKHPPAMAMAMPMPSAPPPPPPLDGSYSSYYPPSLQDLQVQNHIKSRRFYKKKHFNFNNPRFAPYAPRNTTSFIIRAKKSGGIASLISPSPVTPAILPTPRFSPTREGLVDMAKEEWGVDGYGSMSGLIRLRSPKEHEDEDDGSSNSSESDVEEHVEVERRLDHDLSRFEMIYPVENETDEAPDREDDQTEARVARLEEENLTLRERLFLVETEMGELRKRLEDVEKRFGRGNGGGDADGSNGAEETLSGGEEDADASNEVNREFSDGCNDKGEANRKDEGMDLSPARSAGTPCPGQI